MIKTSVIIPVYNTGIYIEECISSVFRQTQKEIEVIAINDGSTDNSLEILLSLKRKYPDLIVITQENNGLGYTRNVGMKRARGEYICFLDSDDYILEDMLEECFKCVTRNKLDLVLFDAFEFEDSVERKPVQPNFSDKHNVIEEREEVFSGIYYLEKYYQKAYTPESCLMYCSLQFLKDYHINFLTGVYFEDNEFYCKVLIFADRVMYLPRMFYQYRCRKNSITGSDFGVREADDHIKVISALADMKSLKEGKGWNAVKKISLNLLRYVAEVCRNNKLYYINIQLSEQILNVWEKICGNTLENIERLEDIQYIFKLCKYFLDSDLEREKRFICSRREKLLIRSLETLPLNQSRTKIAIYGCGTYTEKVLDFYVESVSTIEANVIFLDSYINDNDTKFRGYPVYPVSEIGEKDLDYILISSSQYEEEMQDTIHKLYGDRFTVVSLYGDLYISV